MTIKTLAAALSCSLLLGACALPQHNSTEPAGNAPQTLANTSWMLVLSDKGECDIPPSIAFSDAGRVSGMAGCNNMMGGYTLEGKKLSLTHLATTMKMCGPAFMALESKFLNILNDTVYITQEGERLTLWDKDGKTLGQLAPESAGSCQ